MFDFLGGEGDVGGMDILVPTSEVERVANKVPVSSSVVEDCAGRFGGYARALFGKGGGNEAMIGIANRRLDCYSELVGVGSE